MRRVRSALAGLAAAGTSLGLLGAGVLTPSASGAVRPAGAHASVGTIVIGSANFSEPYIVAQIYGDVLQSQGFTVQQRPELGARSELVSALESGALSIEPDYAGSLLDYLNKADAKAATSITTAVPALRKALAPHGLTVLMPAPAIDTNVFAITKATAKKYHLGAHPSLSQLKPYASQMTLGAPAECPQYAACEPGLEKVYGLHFKGFQSTDEAGPVTVTALKSDRVQIAEFFSTDAYISKNDFVVLRDDKHLQFADHIIPVIRTAVATPKVRATLNKIDAKLTTPVLTQLNDQVSLQHKSVVSVAKAWVAKEKLG